MRLPTISGTTSLHLTYSLNVHPGETWPENLDAIRTHTRAVREQLAPDQAFGLGLRLSAQAAKTLAAPEEIESFRHFLAEADLYVFTINGFPYGRFHGGRVKERVYQPDWTTDARRSYTNQLADILAALLPDETAGSISTVPGGFKLLIRDAVDQQAMAQRLAESVAHLAALERDTGREIHIGLEPEPACFIETTDAFISFYKDVLLIHGRARLSALACVSDDAAERLIRRHLGVCLDTCHAALQFEDPAACMDRYAAEGVRISKVQISAALETSNTESARMALRPFDEPVYLHQVRAQCVDERILAWNDLPAALAALPRQPMAETVRVHFHVPLFWQGAPPLGTTATTLNEAVWSRLRQGACPHLEIETYTFDVLPPALKTGTIVDSVVREYQVVLERLK